MDIAWIKVVVLTLAECVAPEGKTVCQEQQVQYYFVDEVECQKVLEQLIDYRDGFENVIVNKGDSSCQPAAKDLQVFASRSKADEYFAEMVQDSVTDIKLKHGKIMVLKFLQSELPKAGVLLPKFN